MKKLISTAALVVAGLLSTNAQAQTAPPNGWDAHVQGCFAFDPTFADITRGFERLATPANAQRIDVTFTDFAAKNVRMAVWRQECANNPDFPVLMVRFERVRSTALPDLPDRVSLTNRDIELIQGSVVTHSELIGRCAAGERFCFSVSEAPWEFERVPSGGTIVIAQPRNASVILRNAFQFRLRGTTQTVTLGGAGGGGSTGDQTLAGRLNGTYFDPARSGEGIMIDFFDIGASSKGVFVSWYTYDDAGNPLWLVGNTEVAPNGTQVDIPLIVTTGGRFGPLFRAENVRRTPWGTLNIRFPTCGSAVLRYQRTQDGQTGTYNLVRLGAASGVSC